MALEDAQVLGVLLCHYLRGLHPDEALPKVAKGYEDLRIPRIEKINNLGKRYLNGNREFSCFKAAVRDLMVWVMCHLPLRVMLWINPTHLYDVEKEVARYLAAMA